MTLGDPAELEEDDFVDPRLQKRLKAHKYVEIRKKAPSAKQIVDGHQEGRITLVIVNTVPAALSAFDEVSQHIGETDRFTDSPPAVRLLHGRFRPRDRRRAIDEIKAFICRTDRETGAVPSDPGLIVISTQVIEAGFDLSSVRLWSEIAPWASVVQRLGRLNRAGLQPDSKAAFWMPKDDKDRENHKNSPNAKRVGPYDKSELQSSSKLIQQLAKLQSDGTEFKDALAKVSQTDTARAAVEVKIDSLIRPRDFLELFGTEPDLAGGFTDVSYFVRSSDRNADVQVFWREVDGVPSSDEGQPKRDELCNVPVYELQRFVGGRCRAFEWDTETGRWESRSRSQARPGMTLLFDRASGGYRDDIGWTGNARDKPSVFHRRFR